MLLPEKEFKALLEGVDWSQKQLEKPRDQRIAALKEYVGSHYADGGADKRVPVNFIELAVGIYAQQLAPRKPQVLITTRHKRLRPASYEFELAINQSIMELGLGKSIREAVVEALFSVGIVKVGIATTGDVDGVEYGEPFADLVSLDDYIVDMSAKRYDSIQFEGNDYWMDLETVKEQFPNTEDLDGDDHTTMGDDGQERADGITRGEGGETFRKRIQLRDLWIPHKQQLITYAVKAKRQLRVVDWDGPTNGPYYRLGFSDVPGQLMPLPPVSLWMDLHDLGNALFRKLARQGDSYKHVLGFGGGNDDSVTAFKNAKDGDGIKYTGQPPQKLEAGGVEPRTLAFFMQLRDYFSYFAGNIDSLGGLGAQTDTVGQDKMLGQAAGAKLSAMADRTIEFITEICRALAWYEWTDPVRQRLLEKQIPGTELSIDTVWSAETREGRFVDYNLQIDVYSLENETPQAKLAKLQAIVQNYILPLVPLIQQSGGQFHFDKFLKLLARYSNFPELEDIVTFEQVSAVEQQAMQGNPEPSRMPANTTRTYDRVSRPGASRQGKEYAMSQLLMGGEPQPAEAAGMMRGIS